MKRFLLLLCFLLSATSAFAQGRAGGLTPAEWNTFLSPFTGTWNGAAIGAQYGGTGLNGSAATNGFILIGNGSGYTLAGVTGTANQVVVTNGSGTITLSTPQSIHTAATPQFLRLGLNQAADGTASLAATQTGLHSTSTDGLLLQNTTAALVGQTQEYSPRLVFTGAAWKSNATAASETDKWAMENEPQTGAAATTSNLVFQSSLAGGAYATKATLSSGGVLDLSTGYTIGGAAATGTFLRGNGTNFVASTLTLPNAISTGDVVVGTGSNAVGVVAVNATANKVLMSGASAAPTWSTPTFPNASATSRKKIVSDGTNWVASTETWAVPGTSGNVLTSDGTNWTSAAPAASSGLTVSAITADQTAAVGNLYVNNKSGSILAITLPVTATVGQQIAVVGGSNTASFKFIYTTSQKIHLGSGTSTVSTGNVTITEQWATVYLMCTVANNEWTITSYTGTATLN